MITQEFQSDVLPQTLSDCVASWMVTVPWLYAILFDSYQHCWLAQKEHQSPGVLCSRLFVLTAVVIYLPPKGAGYCCLFLPEKRLIWYCPHYLANNTTFSQNIFQSHYLEFLLKIFHEWIQFLTHNWCLSFVNLATTRLCNHSSDGVTKTGLSYVLSVVTIPCSIGRLLKMDLNFDPFLHEK